MTLDAFRLWLVAIDPKATHNVAVGAGTCTVWHEYRRANHFADGKNIGGWMVQIDRYTKDDDDAIANAIEAAIDESNEIAAEHVVDWDEETGLQRHIFDCEVC